MDKKNSIINIQDLGLSAASPHFVDEQPILWVIFRGISIFRKENSILEHFFRISAGSQYPE
jgi:hypothetical protein